MPNHKLDIKQTSPPRRLLSGSPRPGPGQPTKLTPDIQARFCDLLKIGNFVETACKITGIHYSTLRLWIRRGEQGEEPYAEFYRAVNQSVGSAESYHVQVIHEAAQDDWRASQAFLKMRNPDKWNRQEVNIKHTLEKIDDERLYEEIGHGENALEDMRKRIMGEIGALEEFGIKFPAEVIDIPVVSSDEQGEVEAEED